MSSKCKVCNDSVTKTARPGIQCFGSCGGWFHLKCIKMPATNLPGLKANHVEWICETCKKGKRQSLLADDQEPSPFSVPVDLGNAVTALQKDIKLILETLHKNETQFTDFKNTHRDLLKSLQFQMERTDNLEKQVQEQTEKLKQAKKDQQEMKNIIKDMKIKYEEQEQEMIGTNIEIQGIPEDVTPESAINNLCSWLNVDIEHKDIKSCRRNPPRPIRKDGTGKQKSPSVIVTLKNSDLKLKLLQECRKRRPLKSNIVSPGISSEAAVPLYVNEHLTKTKKKLLSDTKKVAKDNNFKYVWVKNGNILVRREEGSKVLGIKCEDDFLMIKKQLKQSI